MIEKLRQNAVLNDLALQSCEMFNAQGGHLIPTMYVASVITPKDDRNRQQISIMSIPEAEQLFASPEGKGQVNLLVQALLEGRVGAGMLPHRPFGVIIAAEAWLSKVANQIDEVDDLEALSNILPSEAANREECVVVTMITLGGSKMTTMPIDPITRRCSYVSVEEQDGQVVGGRFTPSRPRGG